MVGTKLRTALIAAFLSSALTASSSAASWHQWRGPNNNGVAESAAPTEFSATQNVKWRVPIPGHGNSTPIVVGERIFLTTAVRTRSGPVPRGSGFGGGAGVAEHEFVVMALDKATGKVIWRKTAVTATPHEGHHEQYGSFASNSPVSDGQTVFASFGSRGVYAYDLDGNLKWKRAIAPLQMRLGFGEGTALALDGNSLILQHDQQENSYVLVLDKRTGKEIWRADRREESAWAQPLVVEYQGRKQLVTSSTRVRTYDLETGELIWEAGGLGGNAIPAVIQVSSDVVIALTGWRNANLLAIKLGGKGDITGNPEFIKWTNQRGNSYTPSPVVHNGILYLLTDNGMLSAFDALTGDVHYMQQRMPGFPSYKASPVAAGDNLYTVSENGMATVVRLGKRFGVVSANEMGDEMFVSSPVIVDGELFLRSQDELFAISED